MAQKFSIRSGALPMKTHIVGFRGSEGLSRPYAFDVYVNVPGEEEVALEDAIGSKATLSIEDGLFVTSTWSGIFASFELVRAIKGNALYLARLVPQLWQLSLTRHSRMFTKKSIPDVIKAVLDEEGILDYELRLSGTYAEEEHVCQYRESSLEFIHRWAEREGIYYFFEQTEEGEKVVFVDDKSKHAPVATGPVPYHPSHGDMSAKRHFEHFIARHSSLPSAVKLSDYDYLKPALEVNGSANVSNTGFGQVAVYGNRFFSPGEGARVAKIRAEELRAGAAVFHAHGAAYGLNAGFTFALEEHPHLGLNKEYLTTQAEHFAYVMDMAQAWGNLVQHVYDDVYRVDLVAISADQQYRHPSRTPWPRIDGFENGIVDGPATSDYAQIDDHGRYAVKFKFDEGTLKDGKASTFVRMMQPHGGAIEGFHFPLRKGTEVMFLFLGGDPDRPVIAGVVPNAQKPSPVVAANHTQNIIQTGGSNFITIEDLSGSQFINIFCPIFETNLYLGIDRPAGSQALTSGDGPDAAEKGDFKHELGPFNFQLYTKGNGEVYTQGNLNLNASKMLQIEGQAGVYEYAKGEWKRHVDGFQKDRTNGNVSWSHLSKTAHFVGSEAPDSPPHTYVLDVTGDHKIRTTQKSMQHYMTELHEGVATAPVGGFTHTLTVTGNEKIDISTNREVHVGGPVVQRFDDTVTTTHTGETTWNHLSNTTWNAAGKIIDVTCAKWDMKENWHWETGEWKCEHINWLKVDSVLGAHLEGEFGFHGELHIGAHIGVSAGMTFEVEVFHLEVETFKCKTKATDVEAIGAKMKTLANSMKAAAINMTASPVWTSLTAITSMF